MESLLNALPWIVGGLVLVAVLAALAVPAFAQEAEKQPTLQAQGEQQAETTFFHGDLPFFSVMLKMREAMIFHIFMVF